MNKTFAFSDFNLELQVLIRAGEAALDKLKKNQLEALVNDKVIDWEKVYKLACIHQIRPLLLRGISGLRNAKIPPEILQKLKADCFQISVRGLANTNEMLRILKLFKENDIIAVPYKGAYLANKYYGDFGIREFGDIDLFVNRQDISKIKESLIKEDYIPEFEIHPNQEETFFEMTCEYNFNLKNLDDIILYHVEPHFRSSHKTYDIDLTLSYFKENIKQTLISNTEVYILSNEDHLILTLTNHGINESWTSLKYIFDLYQIIQKDNKSLDWDYIIMKLNQLNILPTLLVGMSLINRLFGYNIYPDLATSIKIKKINSLTEGRLKKLSQYSKLSFISQWSKFVYNIKSRTSLSSQIKMIYRHLIVPSESDLKIVILPKKLSFLYLFIRPFRVFKERILQIS